MTDRSIAESGGAYVYCFTRAASIPESALIGFAGEAPIQAVYADGVAAICSPVDVADFQEQMALQTPDWLIPRACGHERVVEAIMRFAPVLPVRFGAVFSSTTALEDYLARNTPEINRFLDRMTGKEEWAVKGYLDMGRAEEWLLAEEADFARRRMHLADSPGTRYFQEKKLRADAQRQARARAASLADDITLTLKGHALDSCSLKLLDRTRTGREHVLNDAFLLETAAVPRFREKVAQQGEAHACRGISLELSGPWPPYHFCPTLEAPTELQL